MRRKHKVRVIYKSGATIDVRCNGFKVRTKGGRITELEWSDLTPNPLHVGVDDIAAVWQVK